MSANRRNDDEIDDFDDPKDLPPLPRKKRRPEPRDDDDDDDGYDDVRCPKCNSTKIGSGSWPWYLGTLGAIFCKAMECRRCGHEFDYNKPMRTSGNVSEILR